jgi:hypothetical protein
VPFRAAFGLRFVRRFPASVHPSHGSFSAVASQSSDGAAAPPDPHLSKVGGIDAIQSFNAPHSFEQ